jgi:hypothetical protein
MTDRTWTGAVSNSASDPGNWSPAGVPEFGDTLIARQTSPTGPGITMDITGDALAGDTLSLQSVQNTHPNTFNLSHNAELNLDMFNTAVGVSFDSTEVVNVSGRDTLNADLSTLNDVSINLAANANLFGSFSGDRLTLDMSSAGNTRYHNDGIDSFSAGSTVDIQPDVVGSGTFSLYSALTYKPTSIEFGGSVSRGQTVDLHGVSQPITANLTVDDPGQFHATVDLHDFSLADFVGLAEADSWSYKNDLLTLRNGCGQVIDRFHIVSDAPITSGGVDGLSVSKTAGGDVLVSPGTDFKGSL